MNIKDLQFLQGLRTNPIPVRDFWKLKTDDVPASPGVYILLAKPSIRFQYPNGKSSIFYIGKAVNLRLRLYEHLKYSIEAKEEKDRKRDLYWPRYEFAASFAGRYTFIHTWQGMNTKGLEDKVLRQFAGYYRSFPVANGAGSWRKL